MPSGRHSSSLARSSNVSRRRTSRSPPVHQRLGRPRPQVVVGGHAEAVSACVADWQQVAAAAGRRGPGPGSRRSRRPAPPRPPLLARRAWSYGLDAVVRLVERRPEQVVHPRVHDHEVLAPVLFGRARGSAGLPPRDQRAPGLQQQREGQTARRAGPPGERRGVREPAPGSPRPARRRCPPSGAGSPRRAGGARAPPVAPLRPAAPGQ